jgi:ABC-type nitrate/sulfonate/bicarbonate transport system substrate-binding protein
LGLFCCCHRSATLAAQPSKLLIARRDQHKVAPLRITKEQGIFKKYGLDVDLVFIIDGGCGGHA